MSAASFAARARHSGREADPSHFLADSLAGAASGRRRRHQSLVSLAQGVVMRTRCVPARTLRIPPEQLRLGVDGQHGQSKQVSYFDPLQRPIRIPGHAAILSRPMPTHPMPQRTVCGY
jgi:hypothetical protein